MKSVFPLLPQRDPSDAQRTGQVGMDQQKTVGFVIDANLKVSCDLTHKCLSSRVVHLGIVIAAP